MNKNMNIKYFQTTLIHIPVYTYIQTYITNTDIYIHSHLIYTYTYLPYK